MRRDEQQRQRKKILAQAAVELAIFGAILLFVIGSILKLGFQQSVNMNQQLRAMRMALSESWKSAQGYYSGGVITMSRNSASFLIVEDRLSVDAGQRGGTRDRIPFFALGSGMFTQNLFLTLSWGNHEDLPVFDLIVNGQRFPLGTSAFTTKTAPASSSLVQCFQDGVAHTNDTRCWEPNCYTAINPTPPPATITKGCVVYFGRAVRDEDNFYDLGNSDPYYNLIRWRYDFGFNGIPDPSVAPTPPTSEAEDRRTALMWQWVPFAGVLDTVTLTSDMINMKAVTFNAANIQQNRPDIDVDGDGETESVFSIQAPSGEVTSFNVLDAQEGDIDFTYMAKGPNDKQGLLDESQMYSRTYADPKVAEGTYFQIKEGKLYSTIDGQFIRNTARQDHVDLVMRVIRLNRDTHRFCCPTSASNWADWPGCSAATAGQPRGWGSILGLMNLRNPVEVCVTRGAADLYSPCFSAANIEKTCMESDPDPSSTSDTPLIFIRSRIEDTRGSRWLTRSDLGWRP